MFGRKMKTPPREIKPWLGLQIPPGPVEFALPPPRLREPSARAPSIIIGCLLVVCGVSAALFFVGAVVVAVIMLSARPAGAYYDSENREWRVRGYTCSDLKAAERQWGKMLVTLRLKTERLSKEEWKLVSECRSRK